MTHTHLARLCCCGLVLLTTPAMCDRLRRSDARHLAIRDMSSNMRSKKFQQTENEDPQTENKNQAPQQQSPMEIVTKSVSLGKICGLSEGKPASEVCNSESVDFALKTVLLLSSCAQQGVSAEEPATIFTSTSEKYLKMEDLCADESCNAVSFCAGKVTAYADKKAEDDSSTIVKSHFAVNVLTYEVARWLFLAEDAVDSEGNKKFEGSGNTFNTVSCEGWNDALKKRDTPNRSGEIRKKAEEKANNFKFLSAKLAKMAVILQRCSKSPPKDENTIDETEEDEITDLTPDELKQGQANKLEESYNFPSGK